MIVEYRYAGPDGDGIDALPAETGAAIGSEYCVHLLPSAGTFGACAAAARRRGTPLLLLTPYFRDAELKAALALFRAIPAGEGIDVAVNDWGALAVLRTLFPQVRVSLGRLLSGQKKCPRIGVSRRLTERGRAWHVQGLFSSDRARAHLARGFGVTGFHVDRPDWAPPPGAQAPGPPDGAALWVHYPFSVVTVSDACPWIGGRSSAAVPACPRPCREAAVRLGEPSMGKDLLQRGKARFVEEAARPDGEAGVPFGTRFVRYDELP